MDVILDRLDPLFKDITTYLNQKKIISRLELRLKIKNLIKILNLSDLETEDFENSYGCPLHQFIFLTLTSGTPQSIQSPLLREKIQFKQMLFYYSSSFKISETSLTTAHKALCELQIRLLKKITLSVLDIADYITKSISNKAIIANKARDSMTCHLFCSILDLNEKISSYKPTSNDVYIIPPGVSIDPFIEFYQAHSNDLLLAEAMVWLIDTELETVSRFIGVPKDRKILAQFTHSQLATLIERNWRPFIQSLD
ncbi:MAG: DUF6834 family protein [Candidatus Helarchaeota archaeon]